MPSLDPNDGGYASRKFWLVVGAIALLTVVGVLSGRWTAIQAIYTVLCGAVTGLCGLYYGANLGNKYLVSKDGDGK